MADFTDRLNRFAAVRGWALLLALAAFTAAAGCSNKAPSGLETLAVEIKGETFHLELALDKAAQHRGLSDRAEIAADGGMLFVFPSEAPRTFVMRRCLVPIDIIFLGPVGEVIAAHAMQVEPYGTEDRDLKPYRSGGKSALVIELAGGSIERLGLAVGDRIELPVLELKRRAR